MNHTSSVTEILTNTNNPIANRVKVITNKPIANSLLVDELLSNYSDLIDDNYTKWFAKKFYITTFENIHRAASEARHDGENPQKLFAFLINKYSRLT